MGVIRPKNLPKAALIRANIPQDYWESDFLNYEGPEQAINKTANYLMRLAMMKEQGYGLMYVGPNGPGKTTAAMIIMKYLARARWNVYCTSLGELVEQIQKTWKSSDNDTDEHMAIERARKCDFLLIDDVGKEHRGQSGFVQTVFDNLIRHRVQHRLPTILTTNFTKSELESTYGESLMSLFEGKLQIVTVDGRDYRRTELKKQVRDATREHQ